MPQPKFVCTFNDEVGDYTVGDTKMHTVDYVGDDLEALIQEVWNDDSYFEKNNGYIERIDDGSSVKAIIGITEFFGTKDAERFPTCIIYKAR